MVFNPKSRIMKKKIYTIIEADSGSGFDKICAKAVENGWRPLFAPIIYKYYGGCDILQQWVKTEPKEK